jgi:hypothetical protein
MCSIFRYKQPKANKILLNLWKARQKIRVLDFHWTCINHYKDVKQSLPRRAVFLFKSWSHNPHCSLGYCTILYFGMAILFISCAHHLARKNLEQK